MRAPVFVDDPDDPRLADYVDLADPGPAPPRRGRPRASSSPSRRSSCAACSQSGRRVRSVLVTPAQFDALADVLSGASASRTRPSTSRPTPCCAGSSASTCTAARSPPPTAGRCPTSTGVLDGARRVAVLRARQRPREPRRAVPQRGRARHRRGAARPGVLRSALPPLRAGLDRPRPARAVDARRARSTRSRRRASRRSRSRPRPTPTPIDEVVWPDRAALLFGAEGPGLSDAWLAAADHRVRIPMRAGRRLAQRRDRGRDRVLRRDGARRGARRSARRHVDRDPAVVDLDAGASPRSSSSRARSWVTSSSVPS